MNQFNTQENKGMLWSILQNAGKFNKLPANFDTQRVFEKHIAQIETKCEINSKLIDLNKQFISAFVNDVSRFESPDVIKKNKVEQFNNSLKQQEDSFNSAMARPMPKTVDFSDKEDEPITNIDDLIAQQLEKRKLDIPKADGNDKAAVQDWLNGTSNAVPIDNSRNIKIGETIENTNIENVVIDINKQTTKPEKKVTWQDSKPPLPNLSSVNTDETKQDKTIHDALLKILKNQDYMINAIHDLQDRI